MSTSGPLGIVRTLLAVGAAVVLASACAGETRNGNSNTNWLQTCASDSECVSGLTCRCGECTVACTHTSDCTSLGSSATCASAAAKADACDGFASPTGSLCLPKCSTSTECAHSRMCVDGACLPSNSGGADAAAGGNAGSGGSAGAVGRDGGNAGAVGRDGGNADANVGTGGAAHPETEGGAGGSGGTGAAGSAGAAMFDGGLGNVCEQSRVCSGRCTDFSSDPANCGTCGHACDATELCTGGACQASGCAAPFSHCRISSGFQRYDACVYLPGDPKNCGSCGHACDAGEQCSGGACVPSCTTPGYTFCNGACVLTDFSSNPENCGSCGHQCDGPGALFPSHECVGGVCVCVGGLSECNGKCTNESTDPLNCGGCGKVCPGTEVCSHGTCAAACDGGLTDCNGACVDPAVDAKNCGGCGIDCLRAGKVCTQTGCQPPACPTGQTSCQRPRFGLSLQCVDTSTDPENCGGCGNSCSNGTCIGGACVCAPGLTNCSGTCVDLSSDPYNCLRCGNSCAPGLPPSLREVCTAAGCSAPACEPGFVACQIGGGPQQTACFCGSCNTECGPTESCVAGTCR